MLLHKHDCVIVPDFGGFVARSYTSSFSKGNNLLTPPSKQILFNKNLKHNDGLLVSALMQQSTLLFNEAEKLIIDYKEYINSLLSVKKRFELQNIGLLYIDAENNLRFEPKTDSNLLIDSFGLEPVVANELVIESEKPVLATHFIDRKAITEVPYKKNKSYAQLAALSAAVPLVIAFLLFAAYSKPMKPILQSSFNPFYSPEKIYVANKQVRKSYIITPIESKTLLTNTNGFATFKLSANSTILVAADSSAKLDKTTVKNLFSVFATNQFAGNFKIVMGCFGIEQNANKLVSVLKQKNIIASITGKNDKGMYVVSCGSFNTKQEAAHLLSSIKIAYPNVWIMAK